MSEIGPPYRPFDKVPPEILSHILCLVLESYDKRSPITKYWFPSIPCQVSRFFSITALSTPDLWSYVALIPRHYNHAHIEERIQHRSGALPLDVVLWVDYKDPNCRGQIRTVLQGCSMRWKTLSIVVCVQEFPWNLWEHILTLPAPLLRSLAIEGYGMSTSVDGISPDPSLSVATFQLHNLHLRSTHFPFGNNSLPGSLEELRVWDNESHIVPLHYIVDSLNGLQSHSLRRLTLDNFSIELHALTNDGGRIVFPQCFLGSLELLEVRGVTAMETVALLNTMLIPNLDHLSLRVRSGHNRHHRLFEPLLQLWKAPRLPKLKRLTLAGMNPPGDSLSHFLTSMPSSVEHLTIARDNEWPIAKLLTALGDTRTRTFCQQMKRLSVSGVQLDTLFDIVKVAFTSLELLELDVIDAVITPWDSKLKTLTAQIEKLKSLPTVVKVVALHNERSSGENEAPTRQNWYRQQSRKSKLS